MADTAYTVLKDFIETKLNAISKLQEVYDNPYADFSGYPAATLIPIQGSVDYETTAEDERVYAFTVYIFHEYSKTTISSAIDALYDAVDDVLDSFSTDKMLSGISLPSGHVLLGVNPVSSGWSEIPTENLLRAEVELQIRISVTSS